MEHANDLDYPRRGSRTGKPLPQERTVDVVVRLLQVNEAHAPWDVCCSPVSTPTASEPQLLCRSIVGSGILVVLGGNRCLVAETAERIGYNFEENFNSMHCEKDTPIVTKRGSFPPRVRLR